jgi:cold shock CspA family protein
MREMQVRGTVKFYNSEKGFGFIYVEARNEDIYFKIGDWKNGSVPCGNDDVEFEIKDGKKGAFASEIKLVKSAESKKQQQKEQNKPQDDRIVCPNCKRKIVPRMITYRGDPDKTVCPYCATQIQSFGGYCFIATAVYQDTYHPNVMLLRNFRDTYLMTNNFGKKFVKHYYRLSPPFADYIENKKLLSAIIKKVFDIFALIYKNIHK